MKIASASLPIPETIIEHNETKHRVIGFDLARAYAIFGMFIVNFNFCFGSIMAPVGALGRFLNVFTGNSTAIFIICAGMGVSLMTRTSHTVGERLQAKSKILKRSWFLFGLGLLLYNWWPGDILHFYGGYMHLAAFILFVPRRFYLLVAASTVLIFHLLLLVIPIATSWDFQTAKYADFWTPVGFLRNTFYNGWNSIFPWFAYFATGMWLGRLNWQLKVTKRNILLVGLLMFVVVKALRLMVSQGYFDGLSANYIMAEYFPPYLPFVMITIGFALIVLPLCMYIGEKFSGNKLVLALQSTGQMTLSHYVIHTTLGMVILALLTNKEYTGLLTKEQPVSPLYILVYSVVFYLLSILFSVLWKRKFRNGPLETLMRKVST
jgi:uncharacterized protein